jgi:hypothetical protein
VFLSAAFAYIGSVTTWVLLALPLEGEALPGLIAGVVVGLASGVLGWRAHRCRRGDVLSFVVGTLATGAVCATLLLAVAAVIVLCEAPRQISLVVVGAPIAMALGALAALPFLPGLFVVWRATQAVGRARAGSILDGIDRRACGHGLTFATALAVAAGSLLAARDAGAMIAAMLVLVPISITLAAFDVRDLLGARRLVAAFAREAPQAAPPELEPGAAAADLGLGDAVRLRTARVGHGYRGRERTAETLRGDLDNGFALVRAGVGQSLLSAGGVVCLGVVAITPHDDRLLVGVTALALLLLFACARHALHPRMAEILATA